MKNPLSYQSTEYDCGPTTMLNAMNYLYHREEISPDVVKCITMYCLDGYNEHGEAYKSGTTLMAMMFLSNWLNQFGRVKNWPIHCEVVLGREAKISQNSRLAGCLQQGGVVVAKVMLGCPHYVLLTGIDDKYVYLFDPYYREDLFEDDGIILIHDMPKKANRKVLYEVLNSEGISDYALGVKDNRECVIIFNKETKQTVDNIEYII